MVRQQQQFGKRDTYTPSDVSQVRCSVSMSLNREETLSEHTLKTFPNSLDVNLHQQAGELKAKVFVLNRDGKPLMPCKPAKARHLLKDKKAKVISRKPFTIQLEWDCEDNTQEIILGIDTGFKSLGFSVVTEKEELLSGEVELRTDVSKKISERAMYRKLKRVKLWYRKPRFNNRVSGKKKGWLAPSIRHKLDTHIRFIEKLKTLLPISKVIVEVAKFDVQKLENLDIKGIEYQEGVMAGYDNVRAFVFVRDKYICQICKKKGGILQVHHIIRKIDGGSDRPDNLVAVHVDCHKRFHAGKIKHAFVRPKSYKESAFMNHIWNKIVDVIGCGHTFGYITKRRRLDLNLEKTHRNDAFVIAGGTTQERCNISKVKQVRRNNRCLQVNRNGFKPSIRRTRYKLQPYDLVRYGGAVRRVKGSHHYGSRVILEDVGSKNIKHVELICHGKGLVFS